MPCIRPAVTTSVGLLNIQRHKELTKRVELMIIYLVRGGPGVGGRRGGKIACLDRCRARGRQGPLPRRPGVGDGAGDGGLQRSLVPPRTWTGAGSTRACREQGRGQGAHKGKRRSAGRPRSSRGTRGGDRRSVVRPLSTRPEACLCPWVKTRTGRRRART
jgi:hypothetical protein